jgi:hypothetical protein
MNQKTFYHIIEWAVALAACVFLGYKLVTFEDYPALWESLRGMAWQHYLALGLCVALMPVNMAIEAWRWKTLWNEGVKELTNERVNELTNERLTNERLTFKEAQRQVYYSKLAGLITPWRLGEYPARGVLMGERMNELTNERIWPRVLSMGAVGSATMTAAIVIAGVVALAFSPAIRTQLGDSYLYALAAVILLLAIAFALAPKALKKYAEVNPQLLFRSLAQSLVRLLCWCLQLALVLWALGAVTGDGLLVMGYGLPIYYLLVTITPNVPIAEVGVRGAWAIVVFGSMNAALAGVLLWVINTLLPCLGWFFFRKKNII